MKWSIQLICLRYEERQIFLREVEDPRKSSSYKCLFFSYDNYYEWFISIYI